MRRCVRSVGSVVEGKVKKVSIFVGPELLERLMKWTLGAVMARAGEKAEP